MPDFGDDVGLSCTNTTQQFLMGYFQRWIYSQKMTSNKDMEAVQKDFAKDVKDFETKAVEPGELGGERFMPGFNSLEERDAVLSYLQSQGIMCAPAQGGSGSLYIRVAERDFDQVTKVAESYLEEQSRLYEEQGLEMPDLSTQEKDAAAPLPQKTAKEDLGTEPPGTKPRDGSWKDELRDRVEAAYRENPNAQLPGFIENCKKQGVEVSTAKDGELMFTHPNGQGKRMRGDTLSKGGKTSFTKKTFEGRPASLKDEARDAAAASKALSKTKTPGRSAPVIDVIQR